MATLKKVAILLLNCFEINRLCRQTIHVLRHQCFGFVHLEGLSLLLADEAGRNFKSGVKVQNTAEGDKTKLDKRCLWES